MGRMRRAAAYAAVLAFVIPNGPGCGTGVGSGADITAAFLKGGSGGSRVLTRAERDTLRERLTVRRPDGTRVPADGTWELSPDEAKVTFTQVDFIEDGGSTNSVPLSDCTMTYKRSESSGASLLDCTM